MPAGEPTAPYTHTLQGHQSNPPALDRRSPHALADLLPVAPSVPKFVGPGVAAVKESSSRLRQVGATVCGLVPCMAAEPHPRLMRPSRTQLPRQLTR